MWEKDNIRFKAEFSCPCYSPPKVPLKCLFLVYQPSSHLSSNFEYITFYLTFGSKRIVGSISKSVQRKKRVWQFKRVELWVEQRKRRHQKNNPKNYTILNNVTTLQHRALRKQHKMYVHMDVCVNNIMIRTSNVHSAHVSLTNFHRKWLTET